jgi:hypothetical protein
MKAADRDVLGDAPARPGRTVVLGLDQEELLRVWAVEGDGFRPEKLPPRDTRNLECREPFGPGRRGARACRAARSGTESRS